MLGDTTGAVLYMGFFTAVAVFGGEYKQHSAAFKYLRLKCEGEELVDGLALSNTHKTAVTAIFHPH